MQNRCLISPTATAKDLEDFALTFSESLKTSNLVNGKGFVTGEKEIISVKFPKSGLLVDRHQDRAVGTDLACPLHPNPLIQGLVKFYKDKLACG